MAASACHPPPSRWLQLYQHVVRRRRVPRRTRTTRRRSTLGSATTRREASRPRSPRSGCAQVYAWFPAGRAVVAARLDTADPRVCLLRICFGGVTRLRTMTSCRGSLIAPGARGALNATRTRSPTRSTVGRNSNNDAGSGAELDPHASVARARPQHEPHPLNAARVVETS